MSAHTKTNETLRSILVSTAATTALLHGGLELMDQPHGLRVDSELTGSPIPWGDKVDATTPLGSRQTGDPFIETQVASQTVPGGVVSQRKQEFAFTAGAYARKFDKDKFAGEIDLLKLAEVVDVANGLEKDGYTVRIVAWGKTSPEDESEDALGGVQTPSTRNEALGIFRRDTWAEEAREHGLADTIQIVPRTFEGGRFTEEGQFDDHQVMVLQGMVEKFGYTDVKTMTDQWNLRPQDSPPAVNEVLSNWIDPMRGIGGMLIAEKEIELPEGEIPQLGKEVCVIPITNVVRHDTGQKSLDVTIPWGGAAVALITLPLAAATAVVGRVRHDREVAGRRTGAQTKTSQSQTGSKTPSERRLKLVETEPAGSSGRRRRSGLSGSSNKRRGSGSRSDRGVGSGIEDTNKARKERRARWPVIVVPLAVLGSWALGNSGDHVPAETPPAPVMADCPPDMLTRNETVAEKVFHVHDGELKDVEVIPNQGR